MEDSEHIFYEDLGSRLQEARRAAGLTQAKFAHKVALTRSSIANMEGGRQGLTAYQVAAFAGELGVDALWLLVGKQPSGSPQPPRPPVDPEALRLAASDLEETTRTLWNLAAIAEDAHRPAPVSPEGGNR